MPQWMKTFLAHASAILLILGVVGYIAKPHAQGFVVDTVDERIGKLETQMDQVQDLLKDQQLQQAMNKNTMEHIQDSQVEMKVDTRMILQSIQNMQMQMQMQQREQ